MARLINRILPLVTILLMLFYTWIWFFRVPYLGFHYGADGQIVDIFAEESQTPSISIGDRLLQVGNIAWEDFERDLKLSFSSIGEPGNTISLIVVREGQTVTIGWTIPGLTANELFSRLNSQWWLAYVLLVTGMFVIFFVRPRDTTWRLLLVFNFLTALWMTVGSGPSQSHIAFSALVLRSLTWLMIPVYLHLHWMFPASTGNLPKPLVGGIYLLAVFVVALEWFQQIPVLAFQFGFLIAMGGSLLLLLIKYILKKDQRSAIRFLGFAVGVILIPSLLITGSEAVFGKPSHTLLYGASLLAFPALPGAYYFVAYQRQLHHLGHRIQRLCWFYLGLILTATLMIVLLSRTPFLEQASPDSFIMLVVPMSILSLIISAAVLLPLLSLPALSGAIYSPFSSVGNLELRANRLFVAYMYFVLLGLALVIGITFARLWLNFPGSVLIIGPIAGLLAALITAYGYSPFRRFVERKMLGIPSTPAGLVETYAARISTTLDRFGLSRVHLTEILPGLLIRQSAMFYWSGEGQFEPLYTTGLASQELPTDEQARTLLTHPEGMQQIPANLNTSQEFGWVKVFLPLRLSNHVLGIWLLGRRDPDDIYTQSEILILQALSGQTAIALANIIQAEELRKLYQSNIDRQEAERTALARELHDEVLNQLAVLSMNIASGSRVEDLMETYEGVTRRLREVIENLRPALLNYGLQPALDELVYGFSDRSNVPQIILDMPASPVRYPDKVEVHLYRIVQQACENALRHAQAQTIWIRGSLTEQQIWLSVSDDGAGFELFENQTGDLTAKKHFGLAGIRERAALIGANLKVESRTGKGTHISVEWRPERL